MTKSNHLSQLTPKEKNMSKSLVCQLNSFNETPIRTVTHKGQLWFSVVDAIRAVKNPKDVHNYWSVLKKRISSEEGGEQLMTNCHLLKLKSSDGKFYETDCVTEETLYELLYEIPSKKTRAFKKFSASLVKKYVDEARKQPIKPEQTPEYLKIRQEGKETRKDLTHYLIKECGKNAVHVMNITDQIYRGLFAMDSKALRKARGLHEKAIVREHLTFQELFYVKMLEDKAVDLLEQEKAKGEIVSSGLVGRVLKELARQICTQLEFFKRATVQMISC